MLWQTHPGSENIIIYNELDNKTVSSKIVLNIFIIFKGNVKWKKIASSGNSLKEA